MKEIHDGVVEQAKAVIARFPDQWDPNEMMAALDFLRSAVVYATGARF